jgi:hypothetical protein
MRDRATSFATRNWPMHKQADQIRRSAAAFGSSHALATVKRRSFSSNPPTAEPGPLAHRLGEIAILPLAFDRASVIQARLAKLPTYDGTATLAKAVDVVANESLGSGPARGRAATMVPVMQALTIQNWLEGITAGYPRRN